MILAEKWSGWWQLAADRLHQGSLSATFFGVTVRERLLGWNPLAADGRHDYQNIPSIISGPHVVVGKA